VPMPGLTDGLNHLDGGTTSGPTGFYGTLQADGKTGSGLVYARNRYVDPQTGKFTQADPIGLASGVNAWGFVGGDPVSYSDPFGLYGCRNDDTWCLFAKAGWEALGGALGTIGGGAVGFVGSLACLEVCAPVGVPAAAVAGGVAGVHTAGRLFDNVLESRASGSDGSSRYKEVRSGLSGKEGAKNIPSWAQGERPFVGENGKSFAKRLLDDKYGTGNWGRGAGTEFNQLQKFADRNFIDPIK
jgi:RHS repeat-associated protein